MQLRPCRCFHTKPAQSTTAARFQNKLKTIMYQSFVCLCKPWSKVCLTVFLAADSYGFLWRVLQFRLCLTWLSITIFKAVSLLWPNCPPSPQFWRSHWVGLRKHKCSWHRVPPLTLDSTYQERKMQRGRGHQDDRAKNRSKNSQRLDHKIGPRRIYYMFPIWD